MLLIFLKFISCLQKYSSKFAIVQRSDIPCVHIQLSFYTSYSFYQIKEEVWYVETLQMARVMMMVDVVVPDLSFKACEYGGALLSFFITRT